MGRRIYADFAATAPVRPQARAAVAAALELTGNASSVHAEGRAAKKLLEDCRERVAAALGAAPQSLVFTSGATEACNLGLAALDARRGGAGPLVFGDDEHDAVWAVLRRLDHDQQPGAPLAARMLVNNETGLVHDVKAAALEAKALGGFVFSDCVQALGKIDIALDELAADAVAVSGHKIGGPMGVGALALAQGIDAPALILGGGQERGARGGTENLPAIAGFAAAVAAALQPEARAHLLELAEAREAMEAMLQDAGAVIVGADRARVQTITCAALPGVRAETQVMAMDLEGVAVSAGAACSSGKVKESRALKALGLPDAITGSAIRLSFGWATTPGDIAAVGEAWARMAKRLKR